MKNQIINIKDLNYESSIKTFYGSFHQFSFHSGKLEIVGLTKTVSFKRINHRIHDWQKIQARLEDKTGQKFKGVHIWVSMNEIEEYFILLHNN